MNRDVLKLRMQDTNGRIRWLKTIVRNDEIVGINWTENYDVADDFTDVSIFMDIMPTRILEYLRYLSKNRKFVFDIEEQIDTKFFNSMIECKGE